MANPVLVEVLRGAIVESAHRGSVAVVDADGGTVLALGDVEHPIFPRSAVKAIQALPLLESGAADAYGFRDREIALACASHSGEPEHAKLAAEMLGRAGLDRDALECGTHWPLGEPATIDLARSGAEPSQLHNNCSGKHAGFVCTCMHAGVDRRGYVDYGHRMQAMLRSTMEEVTGAIHGEANMATDGCSIPTYAVPLRSLALGFARMATGVGMGVERIKSAKRIFAACMAEPFYVSGTGRMDMLLMQAGQGRIFAKTGAEAVYCAALPEQGLGIAVKCDDGATRAAETIVASVLAGLLASDESLRTRLSELAAPAIRSRRGAVVGQVRPAEALTAAPA
ncbi:asparaginase [Aquibium oceanicum]|uniref:Asparaginase n=1 Tax=Aquibium oceanicum TaxID=1670800 RepID=A0A1L3SPY1_9HYPH|nr:asparaginase [Aquibium oceanicum]APH71487.1 asparaginase [Aquibium oceanicum]